MIPYFRPDALVLLSKPFLLAIQPWGVMVALGFMLGSNVCQKYAARRGINPKAFADIVVWLAVGALVFGHIGWMIYEPEAVAADPLVVLKIWDGLSSMGGFFGCTLLAIVFFKRQNIVVLRGGDILMIGLAFGYFLGRVGCFIVHDHPGKIVEDAPPIVQSTIGWLGVEYPDRERVTEVGLKALREGEYPEFQARIDSGRAAEDSMGFQVGMYELHLDPKMVGTTRFDLGLHDALVALALFGLLALLARKPRREGLLLAVTPLFYMPIRFLNDFLRNSDLTTQDSRYGGLTPAQYGAIVLFLAGLVLLVTVVRTRPEWPEPGTEPYPAPKAA